MNNLIFNTTASELKSSMYGYNQTSLTLQQLQLDSSGNMLITGNITVNNSVTIANATLTVEGSVTVNNSITIANATLTVEGSVTVNNSITIANATLTVEGSVTVNNSITIANATLTVEGSVTVNNSITIANATLTVEGSVTIANTTLTVLISGQTFTSDTDTLTDVTGTGNVFTATNISTLTTASMFIDNIGDNTVTYSLLISPDGTTYFEDPNYIDKTVAAGEKAVIAIDIFAQYAQLEYNLGGTTASFNAYYNGQA